MKKILVICVLLVTCFGTMGNQSCSQEDTLTLTEIALANLKPGIEYVNARLKEKCAEGRLTDADCAYWFNPVPVTDIIETDTVSRVELAETSVLELLPWAVQKLTEKEQTELAMILNK